MKQQPSTAFDGSAIIAPAHAGSGKQTRLYGRGAKRLFDVVGASLIIALISPLLLILYVAVRLDGGQGLYGHTRVGRNGQMFRCWKLRTMVVDSDEALRQHLARSPEAAAEWSSARKLTDDPRITRLGQVLRRTSLDELPQLWNVLTGEMSLVGPRPVTLEELDHYGAYKWAYLSATPGMTGLWQVSGRNTVSYQRRVALDVAYVRNTSFAWDLSILMQTVRVVVLGTGR